jgi:hypothetical protein
MDGLCDLAMKLAFSFVNLGHRSVPFRKKWAPRAHFSSWGNVVFRQDSTSIRGRTDAFQRPGARIDALERERADRRAAEAVAVHAPRGSRPRVKKRRAAAVATRA